MNRKLSFQILLLFLILFLAMPTFAETNSSPQPIIKRILHTRAYDGKRNKKALKELAGKFPELAEKWERILDLWDAPVAVNRALPDGLPDDDTLCLVCLGFHLNANGTMRQELVERLRVFLAASQKYPRAVLVCTGGPTAYSDPDATEAGRMAEWLVQNGVDPSRILVEDQSLTTAQNAIFTYRILAERCPQVTSVAIISSDYHIATGVLLFGAEPILRGLPVTVVSNAAWHAPSGSLSASFQASALLELSVDAETEHDTN